MRHSFNVMLLAGAFSAFGPTPPAAALSVPDEPPPRRVASPAKLAPLGGGSSVWSVEPGGAMPSARNRPGSQARAAAADFGKERASAEARAVADWVVRSDDNRRMPFLVIDKKAARLYVFNSAGRLDGASPILLGWARGDHSVPGIGERKIQDILPHERTTPAGRFVAEKGRNHTGEDIVWVSYEDAVSIHRVRAAKKEERRLQRLASSTPADNRISYGCINVPAKFYDKVVSNAFAKGNAVVYVLPETQPALALFGA